MGHKKSSAKKLAEPAVTITKLTIKRCKGMVKPETCFLIDLEFIFPKGDSYLLDSWKEFHEITTIPDPKAYKKEIYKRIATDKDNTLDWINDQKPIKYTKAWTFGRDKLRSNKKREYKYKEYITSTPVTEAILAELRKIKRKPTHSYKTTTPYYFIKLLEALDNHWD